MPRGGRRVGSGRKPGTRRAVVLGMDGLRVPPHSDFETPQQVIPLNSSGDDLSIPPKDLPAAQRRFWAEWAPLALALKTLTIEKVPGFRQLCERAELSRALFKQLRKLGLASDDAAEIRRAYDKATLRVNSSLAEFQLTGTGKPATSGASGRKTADNPWAQVAGR